MEIIIVGKKNTQKTWFPFLYMTVLYLLDARLLRLFWKRKTDLMLKFHKTNFDFSSEYGGTKPSLIVEKIRIQLTSPACQHILYSPIKSNTVCTVLKRGTVSTISRLCMCVLSGLGIYSFHMPCNTVTGLLTNMGGGGCLVFNPFALRV